MINLVDNMTTEVNLTYAQIRVRLYLGTSQDTPVAGFKICQ